MKTTEPKTTTQNLHPQEARQPFFQEDRDGAFFSEAQPTLQPFFDPGGSSGRHTFFSSSILQPKLKIGRPGDRFEQEADSVADQVVDRISNRMAGGGQEPVPGSQKAAALQPLGKESEPEKEGLKKEKEETLQGKELQRKPIFESNEDGEQGSIRTKLAGKQPVVQKQEAAEEDKPEGMEEALPEMAAAEPASLVEGAESREESATEPASLENAGPETAAPASPEAMAGEGPAVTEALASSEPAAPAGKATENITPETQKEPAAPEPEATAKPEAKTTPPKTGAPKPEAPAKKTAGEAEKATEPPSPEEKGGEEPAAEAPESTEAPTNEPAPEAEASEGKAEASETEGETTEVAEEATEKGEAEGKAGGGPEALEEGGETGAPEFPEPDAQIPGALPPPLTLGISKSGQEKLIQSKNAAQQTPPPGLAENMEQSRGKGASLDSGTLEAMGQQFGADFSGVRIHADEAAAGMNSELGAKAFTHGKDIYFNQGQFDTGSPEGKKLLAHELTHTVQQGAVPISPKLEDTASVSPSGNPPAIQRGVLSSIGGAISSGFGWVKDKVSQIGSAAWENVQGIGANIGEAWQQTNFKWTDSFLQGIPFLFRFNKNLLNISLNQAMAAAEERQAVKAGGGTVDEGLIPDPTPEQLKVLRGGLDSVNSVGDTIFGIQEEIWEGAVIGDFKENPSIWNTIGQIAMGFVPYAGQVADVRDLVAGIIKLKEGGWKDPWDYFNIVLIGIGFIPGIGDAIKAGGRALKGPLKKVINFIGKNGDVLWKKGSGLVKSIWKGAGDFGRRAIDSAKEFGSKMLAKAKEIGPKLLDSVRSLGTRAKNFAKGLGEKIRVWGGKAKSWASGALSKGRGLLSKVGGAIGGAARSVFNSVKGKLGGAISRVAGWISKGRALIGKISSGIAKKLEQAKQFVKDSVSTAISKGKALYQAARAKVQEAWQRAKEVAGPIITKTVNKVKDYYRRGKDWVVNKAIKWVRTKFRMARDRIKAFLKAKIEKIKRKLGLSQDVPNRSQTDLDDLAKDPAHGGKMTPQAARERDAALALEKNGDLPAPVSRASNPESDFIDGKGQKWDHKGFRSTVPNPKGKGAFKLNDAVAKVENEFRKGNNVIIDTRLMSEEHIAQLRRAAAENNWGGKVVWHP